MFKTSNRHRSYPSKIILIWCLLASNIVEVLCDQTNQTVLSSDISSSSVSFSSPHTNNVPKLSFSNDSNSSKEYNKSLTNITPLSTHSVHSSELSIHQESSKNEINQSSSSKSNSNETNIPTTSQTSTQTSVDPNLPHKGAAEEERHSSMAIFFVLSVIASCIFLIHFILETKFQYIPESLAVVFLGAAIGLVMKLSSHNLGDWKKEETLSPTMFFLILLPPIIYESGYTLHKGNFFQNIGSILVFAIIGTSISAFVIGGGVYVLGALDIVYKLSFTESFAFGSLISAVDPVATLAIFHALNLDLILNMLVFGESILNDAVSIVLATTALELNHLDQNVSGSVAIFNGFVRFFIVFFGSAAIGAAFALIAALIFKYVDLRKHPSLEFGMMLILIYAPYGLAEGLHLSGIMAILFNGVVMSHYAHFNLSPVTQITMQQTLRTLAFIAETCVFAYLGLAIFSFRMKIEMSLIVWSIILCLIGRAVNIYPLSYFVNYFREHKITKKMMFIMWFCGLRGAIAYALALHLNFEEEKRRVIVTTTLIIVLFTITVMGSSTMPVLKYMNRSKRSSKGRRRRGKKSKRLITLSKTQEMGQAIETEHLSELTEEELEVSYRNENNLKGFVRFDARYMMPLFTRIFTDQEVKDCKSQMTDLTNRWYQTVRRPSESEEERDNLYVSSSEDECNKNNNLSLHLNDEDDGIFGDVEEGRIGSGGKKIHRNHQKKSNPEKQLLCGVTEKAIYENSINADEKKKQSLGSPFFKLLISKKRGYPKNLSDKPQSKSSVQTNETFRTNANINDNHPHDLDNVFT